MKTIEVTFKAKIPDSVKYISQLHDYLDLIAKKIKAEVSDFSHKDNDFIDDTEYIDGEKEKRK